MIDFSNVKNIVIPEGEVAVIARGDEILWEKQVKKYKRELAYLKSTGTQWIDTGAIIPPNLSIEIKFSSTAYSSGDYTGYYIGVMNNGSRGIGIRKSSASTVLVTDYGRNKTTAEVDSTAEWNEVFVNINDKTLTADGAAVQLKSFGWSGNNPTPLALFGTARYGGGIYSVTKVAIAHCKLYDSSMNVIRDYIPVLDWNDRPCMYDKVTDELFYNQGTGEFLYAELEGDT